MTGTCEKHSNFGFVATCSDCVLARAIANAALNPAELMRRQVVALEQIVVGLGILVERFCWAMEIRPENGHSTSCSCNTCKELRNL